MKSWIAVWFCLPFVALQTVSPFDDYDNGTDEKAVEFNAKTQVKFYLYSSAAVDPTYPQLLKWDRPESVTNSLFIAAIPTRFIIHGYKGGLDSDTNSKIIAQYFDVGDFNVIVVDWGEGSRGYYYHARKRVAAVGRTVSKMIDTLVQATRLSFLSIILIGHGLGAHVAAAAGKAQRGKIGTIVGLDPAGPGFVVGGVDTLNERAAEYVEVIHTSARFGITRPIGDADFYVNGGYLQPGCGSHQPACHHRRAVDYYAESLSSSVGFWAKSHKTAPGDEPEVRRMGGEPSNFRQGVRGVYYVKTESHSPFALGRPPPRHQ
ncbi:phospholipase A1-like [Topomyia yanbarensis]|uniref:phospholipase A1-like n=1 Tax=Topomyia yanbarensis TaxID=2498891 RepID=UPI00273C2856|nr:phospholipase A1-like [Topomyia yanbarensis]